MTDEYRRQNLEQLIIQQTTIKQSAVIVFTEHQTLWQKLGFNQMQVSLWLASLPLNNHLEEPAAVPYQTTPDVAAHLVSLLQQAGGRMPLAQVLKKLPVGITTSEQQIRKLAQKHAQIEIKGPLLVLIN
ncbi:hypothetical protein HGT70_00935 [Rosenbergiella collisarenosi]|uniref:hypothetical protein n=1 Tax=Rosenbergiella collisarenosi TaxID=1544695 RepID=UPI001BDB1C7F|nr:hypothetical protein [Rosenbergiella collisarenosi]MBT0719851.1 hypothetical protein [Rosenbergiella collisarenosi]